MVLLIFSFKKLKAIIYNNIIYQIKKINTSQIDAVQSGNPQFAQMFLLNNLLNSVLFRRHMLNYSCCLLSVLRKL